MSSFVWRVACGVEIKGQFRPITWVTDVTDDGAEWDERREKAARYFLAVDAHSVAEHARRKAAMSLRKTGEEIRVMRARVKS